jgi:polyferredoxin/Pyruvate/2-oxoacid:ferredoxin oxidoreductase delta subunit
MRGLTLRRVRLASQILFFSLFVFLLVRTEFPGAIRTAALDVRIPWPVGWFLEADPLVALATALSTGTLYRNLFWALPFLVLAILVGRAFCGWMCPLGSLHHFVSSLKSDAKRGAKLIESNRYKRWQAAKYHLLAAVLVMALFGSAIGLLLDPISFLVRSMSTAVLPAVNGAIRAGLDPAYTWPIGKAGIAVKAAGRILYATVLSFKQPHFHQAFFIGGLFVFVLVLNSRVTRFWCRAICPLGALLGVCSRWSLVQMRKHDEKCDDCRRCLLHCQGGDDPIPGAAWRKAECHLCLNCLSDCPTGGISFAWSTSPSPAKQTRETPEFRRRALFTSMAAGAAMLPLLRSGPGVRTPAGTFLIRPPGSLDESHFLDRCIRCGDCMKVCPNNALHPATLEGGVEAIWSPVLVPRIGYCEPNCVLCSQVCPTGAIWEITVAEKTGTRGKGQGAVGGGRETGGQEPGAKESAPDASQDNRPAALPTDHTSAGADESPAPAAAKSDPIRIGTAFYDRGRCLPWGMATECIVCEEWCPTSPKAIYLVPAEVVDRNGQTKTVRQPFVDPKLCTGCGACEYACPIKGSPAIYVTSAGETRSRTNQFLLRENQPRARQT